MRNYSFIFILLLVAMFGCEKSAPGSPENPDEPAVPTVVTVSTDKARYNPGDEVTFTTDQELTSGVKIRYRHLNELIAETSSAGKTWTWKVPAVDFTGYMVDIYKMVAGKEKAYGSVAVDVSSDWARFPRYGFLSKFGQMSNDEMQAVISNLNRYHINGLQFYDWHFKHHRPLAGTPAIPDNLWTDIANRETSLSTVRNYISEAHVHNMKTMFYNLAYGALNDAESEGVKAEWYLYDDNLHNAKDKIDLPAPLFKSNIWLLDPSNTGWQQYMAQKNKDVYAVFDFDGYHIDQLGNRDRILYSYSGNPVDMPATFNPFIKAMKQNEPQKRLVMNAVNQYGQEGIALSPVDFLYSEVWAPNEGYGDLVRIIQDNNTFSKNTKNTILAAYMNYNLAGSAGNFNTPGVLLADAVIFAFGGAHLELGEHMLGKEYFPNNNLQMRTDLKEALVHYYDFMVGYQNLLRDGGTFNSPQVASADTQIDLNNWPPQLNKVSIVGKEIENKQVIHLINFTNAVHLNWRDANGTQSFPKVVENFKLDFTTAKTVKKIWMASPDFNCGAATEISFSQSGSKVSFSLPQLQYWDMVVVEY